MAKLPIRTAATFVAFAALVASGCHPKASTIKTVDGGSNGSVDGGFWVNTSASVRRHTGASLLDDGQGDLLQAVAAHTVATWLIGAGDPGSQVGGAAKSAKAAGGTMVLIVYNMPNRDCGQYSAGGTSASDYGSWIGKIAGAIGDTKTMIILEPDALALTDCLDEGKKVERFRLLTDAVQQFKRNTNTSVYIDAGHPDWKTPEEVASRLKQTGIDQADGFALNSDNYYSDDANIAYGQKVRAIVQKNFVIDTSRNGNGPNGQEWCNPRGRATGKTSTYNTGVEGVDAFVWMHNPGESDGTCNGGPAAGQFWNEIAIEQARNGHLTTATTSPTTANTNTNSNGTSSAPPTTISGPVATTAPTASGLTGQLVGINPVAYTHCVELVVKNGTSKPTTTWTATIALGNGVFSQHWNLKIISKNTKTVVVGPAAAFNSQILAGATSAQQGFCVDLPASNVVTPSLVSVQ